MNIKTGAQTTDKRDIIKWLIVMLLVGSGIVSFYYFDEKSVLIRVVSLLVLAIIAAWIASKTERGKYTLDFIHEAHIEVRRVVWPTRQETIQMTSVVLFMVVLLALVVWLLDSVLMSVVRLLTGHGG
ncbi:preprotein translocase subunit SecE [Thioploca ingrica]|uniref:Protein translocase subunit SecE n=1 Tax=Thioploca ingrica TaxID=40754 RepID=A0A090AM81_9GAMM|nr:preprotein translocase subunit SecE [Thioploca ingrica]